MRNTDTEYLTGIIQCPFCELKYFLARDKGFNYYRHYPKGSCKQKPKSMKIDKMNNLFEVFYFYFYLVYDDTKVLIEENQKLIRLNQLELKDKIKNIETESKKYDKQIERFQSIYEETHDNELLKLTLVKEKELNRKREENNLCLSNLRTELEELDKKYDEDEMELTYYDVKEKVVTFFEKLSVEEKRISIIKIIKYCQLFNNYLLIDIGKVLFIFNIDQNYIITKELYNLFKKDKLFKDNFLNSSRIVDDKGLLKNEVLEYIIKSKEEIHEKYTDKQIDKFITNLMSYVFSRVLGDMVIDEYYLKNVGDTEIKIEIEKRLQMKGIDYNLMSCPR